MSNTTPDRSKTHILLVDDEEDVVEVVSHFLEEEGYTVLKAYDGEEAILKAEPHVNLIVLDIMLPRLDGYQVCKRLRARADTEQIPIIFPTAHLE